MLQWGSWYSLQKALRFFFYRDAGLCFLAKVFAIGGGRAASGVLVACRRCGRVRCYGFPSQHPLRERYPLVVAEGSVLTTSFERPNTGVSQSEDWWVVDPHGITASTGHGGSKESGLRRGSGACSHPEKA